MSWKPFSRNIFFHLLRSSYFQSFLLLRYLILMISLALKSLINFKEAVPYSGGKEGLSEQDCSCLFILNFQLAKILALLAYYAFKTS